MAEHDARYAPSRKTPLSEALRLVVTIAGGNKDVWYGQADVEKERAALARVESEIYRLESLASPANYGL